jgi:SAM-dependent methyltransferase
MNQIHPGPERSDTVNRTKRKLNLGSGKSNIPDALTVDRVAASNPDVVHDLDVFPWPFEDNSFESIYCFDVLEHLRDIVKTMEEVHRISENGAHIHIATPHFSCANSYTDPTHIHHLGYFFLDYFTGENQWDFYTKARFKKIRSHLHFYGRYKNLHISWLANRFPRFYEEHLTWIFPAWYMSFELEVIK